VKISVIGLGYVGCVSAACLASRGHQVVGVDVSPVKVDLIRGGHAPVVEERIGELTADVVAAGALRATTDIADAVASTEISLVCVGTPSAGNGSLSTEYLERVAEQIGTVLAGKQERHTIVFRSRAPASTCSSRSWRRPRARWPGSTSASRSTRSTCARVRACATSSSRPRR
jgi:GDP-mannose 6-dehydrogenase